MSSRKASAVTAIATIPAFSLLIVLTAFSHSAMQDGSNLKVAVDLVLLDVSVQDKNGQPVRNLGAKDFKIYEDKVEQRIASFSTEESPVSWGLVLDRSRSMQAMMKDVYQSALNVIDQGTTEDEMFIMTFNNKTELVTGFTPDRLELRNFIFGLNAEGNTALYDAIDSGLAYIKKGKHRKKVLVVITDGGDNRSRIRYSQLIDRVKESDVLIYTAGMYGGMISNPTIARTISGPKLELQELAEITGAYAHFPSDSDKCREAMEKIAREVSEHYTIGYYSSNPGQDGRWRAIKVVAGQPNVKYTARVRKGYYASGHRNEAKSAGR